MAKLSAELVYVNGAEVWGSAVERPGVLYLTIDYGDWRGLRLHQGQRLPVRRGELADRWLYVAGETPIPGESCRVELRERYDGPTEEPPPRPRPERPARSVPTERYEGQIITFPKAEAAEPARGAGGPIIRFPGPDSPPPAAVLAVDQGGAHAELLRAGERWLRVYKPAARFAVFFSDEGEESPMSRITIRRESDGVSA